MATREEKAKKESNGTKLPIMLIVIVAVLAIGGSVGGTLIANKFLSPNKETAKTTPSDASKISKDEVIVPMDEFLVNLAKGTTDEQQYIRVKMSLLTKNEEDSKELTKNIALARDSAVNILRQKKAADILSAPDSVLNLKKQMKEAINKEYGKSIVKDVFVTDLVIQ